jgi:hypothetical protein
MQPIYKSSFVKAYPEGTAYFSIVLDYKNDKFSISNKKVTVYCKHPTGGTYILNGQLYNDKIAYNQQPAFIDLETWNEIEKRILFFGEKL